MNDNHAAEIREIRENQIVIQTQVKDFKDAFTELNANINRLISKLEEYNKESNRGMSETKEWVRKELKGYVQFKDIATMQKIIYGSVGTVLTFVALAILGLLMDKP